MKSNIGYSGQKAAEKIIQEKNKRKKRRRKFWSIVVIIFTFLMIVLGIGFYVTVKYLSNQAEENQAESLSLLGNSDWQNVWNSDNDQADSGSGKLEVVRGDEGDILSDDEINISLNLTERRDVIGEQKARNGYEFIVLNLIIRNQKEEEILFYSSNFILRDSRYTEYVTRTINNDEINSLKTMQNISSKGEINGNMVYEVKKEVGRLELIYMGKKKLIFGIK